MPKKKADERYRLPILKNRNGDLSKRWFIEYYAWNPTANKGTGTLERQVRYCPLKHKTSAERKRWASNEINTITNVLLSGFFLIQPKEPSPQTTPIPKKPAIPHQPDQFDTITLLDALDVVVRFKENAYRARTGQSDRNAYRRLNDFLVHKECTGLLLNQTTRRLLYEFSDYIINVRGLSARYRNNLIADLRGLFTGLVKREYITKNPAEGIEELPVQTSRVNLAFTESQQTEYESFLRDYDPALFAFTRFVYQAFLRPVELMRMQVRDIELSQNRIACHMGTLALGFQIIKGY